MLFVSPLLSAMNAPQLLIGVKGGGHLASDDRYAYPDPIGSLISVYGGLRFSPDWSWSLGYQYHGDLKADVTLVNVKTSLFESGLRYDLYLQDSVSLYGRLGGAYWDMEKMHPFLGRQYANGFSSIWEVGVSYSFDSNVRLSLGYQYIDGIGSSETGKYDSHGLLAGLSYSFGRASEQLLSQKAFFRDSEDFAVDLPLKLVTYQPTTVHGFFKFDSIEFKDDVSQLFSILVSLLNSFSQSRVVIVGHTDSTGRVAYNQALSERRAQAVVDRLIDLGAAPDQIEWRGEGASRPIADNGTKEGRARNRRFEIFIPGFQIQEYEVSK